MQPGASCVRISIRGDILYSVLLITLPYHISLDPTKFKMVDLHAILRLK